MIILATAVVITLSNSGIISKANDAVDVTDLSSMQDLATMLWADAYLDGKSGSDLVDAVQDGLLLADKNYATKYDVLITDSGVTVKIKESEDEPDEEETETITQLAKPTITISEDTLVIVDNATNGGNTAGFEIYVGSEKKVIVTTTTYDLTTLDLRAGTYNIMVKAVASEDSTIAASELSEAVEYVVTEVSNVPIEWQAYVVDVTEDGVPIPKGFVTSPYAGENTKNGGLVIYELGATETEIPSTETYQKSLTTRNQYVWVPVDKNTFSTANTQFKRTDYLNSTSQVIADGAYNKLGTAYVYWELELDEDNMPKGKTLLSDWTLDGDLDYISEYTITEAQAMYASVKEYGGFYIGRYEAGIGSEPDAQRTQEDDDLPTGLAQVHSKMGQIPYTYISCTWVMDKDSNGAVSVARSLYPNDSSNTTGVISTLTYGVQWDRTLDWIKSIKGETFSLTLSKDYGNFRDHTIESGDLNKDAKFWDYSKEPYKDVTYDEEGASTSTKESGTEWALSTGALKVANLNNIYDMAGNVSEWTMEGYSSYNRVNRGSSFILNGAEYPVSRRGYFDNPLNTSSSTGFRVSLYIKK